MDEWLPQRHLARFVVAVIDGMDLSVLAKAYGGSGIASYHPAMLLGANSSHLLRVVHFVGGGGTGATRVALDLALTQSTQPGIEPHLILRDKGRALPRMMQQQIDAAKLPTYWVPNLMPRGRVTRHVEMLCEKIQPHVFLAHGYSEHIWGRRAAASSVPVIIHVEHNTERYWPWRVWAARRLTERTAATICVSSAVERNVHRLRIGAQCVLTLHSGIDTTRFRCDTPLAARSADILMPARFASSKDQATLIRAAGLLVQRGWQGRLLLAGGGKPIYRRRCERLVEQLALSASVQFLGAIDDLPVRLASCRVAVLSSRREGLPLVLAEAMSAGCAVVASAIPGITDIVHDAGAEANGWLFSVGDAAAAAETLWQALNDSSESQRRADNGRRDADHYFSLEQMARRYDGLIKNLVAAHPALRR